MRTPVWSALASAACLALAGCSSSSTEPKPDAAATPAVSATRAPDRAPDNFKVVFDTSKGEVVMEIHRDWAPLGVDRFHELLSQHYFDGARFFRVIRDFIVQFGLAADPAVTRRWVHNRIADDPVIRHNARGTVTFATAGPGTRTTQLFINLKDNSEALDGQGFEPIGEVVSGMDVVDRFYDGYGESPDQTQVTEQGNSYLDGQFPRLDYTKKATIQ